MRERQTRADLNGFLSSLDRLFKRARKEIAHGQRVMSVGIFFVKLNSPQRRFDGLTQICRRIITPSIANDAFADTTQPHGRFGQLGIKLDCLAKQLTSAQVRWFGNLVEVPGPLPHQVPGAEIAGAPSACPQLFALQQLRLDRLGYALGDLVLDLKDVAQLQIVAFSPDVSASLSINKLSRNPNAPPRLADAALKYVAHGKFTRHFLHSDRFSFEGKARVACNHQEPSVAR